MTAMVTPHVQNGPVEFVTSYEGDALARHTMPVRDLAPALLALGQAFDRANAILNGSRMSISLDIRATSDGSFQIHLVLQQVQQALEQAAEFFNNDFFSSAANIKELFFGGGGLVGLIGLIKRFRGAPAKEVERTHDAVTLEMGQVRLVVPAKVFDLYRDGYVRQQLEAVVRPLTKPGIVRVVFRDRDTQLETVSQDDVAAFRQEPSGSDIATEIVIPRQRLIVAVLNFASKDGKWKLNDGEVSRWYSIKDRAFLKEVDDGARRFGKGDVLICEVVVEQFLDSEGGLKMAYSVTAVLDQIGSPQQPSLARWRYSRRD